MVVTCNGEAASPDPLGWSGWLTAATAVGAAAGLVARLRWLRGYLA
jgi:hypothetical protein